MPPVVVVMLVGALVVLIILSRVVIRALAGPRKLTGDALCGSCRYPVTHPVPEACPECGKDLLKVGIVTPGQGVKRPGMLAALVAWAAISVIVGWPAGSYAADRLMRAQAQAARAAARATRTFTQNSVLGYRAAVDPRAPSATPFTIYLDESSSTGSGGAPASRSIRILVLGNSAPRGAVPENREAEAAITADLVTGTVTYRGTDGKEQTSAGADAAKIEALLRTTSIPWPDGAAAAHAAALKLFIDTAGDRPGPARLEPAYAIANLRTPACVHTQSSSSTMSGAGPVQVIARAQLLLVSQLGIPAALLVIGLIVIPMRMRSVRRREERDLLAPGAAM